MDITRDKPIRGVLYANTKLQRLDQHLFAVGFVAKALYQHFFPERKQLSKAMFLSGCLHDIGKIDPGFQSWVTKEKNKAYVAEDGQHVDDKGKFSFENHPRHNEISVLLYHLLDNKSLTAVNRKNKLSVKHAIYWHHAKPLRAKSSKKRFETYGDVFKILDTNLSDKAWIDVVIPSIALLNKVCGIEKRYNGSEESYLLKCFLNEVDEEDVIDLHNQSLPRYKEYDSADDDLEKFKNAASVNAINNEIRACLITADRWVSAVTAAELEAHIANKSLDSFVLKNIEHYIKHHLPTESILTTHINECLHSFPDNDRSQKQSEVAQKLAEDAEYVKVLAGAAGCGKTKIALEWAKLRNAKQIIWICPRVQICQGLFTELRDCDTPYLPNATIEIHTGEFKYTNSDQNITAEEDYFTGDIVITTIDQILNSIISHSQSDRLLNYLNAHVVFDEYHEYISMPAFNLLFAELLKSREKLHGGASALLVSATPHYAYVEQILGLDKDCDIIEMPSFNPSCYQFKFEQYDEKSMDENNPLFKRRAATTFVISNTAITAQKSFIQNQNSENAVLFHSKFKKSDKQRIFNSVYEAFKRDGNRKYDLLRSGPIIQASLNVTCDNMVSEITTAENTLQRLGRLDRFGLNTASINTYLIAVPETLTKGRGSVTRILSASNLLASTRAWHDYLLEATNNGEKKLTLPEIYTIYRRFYNENSGAIKAIEKDLLASMKESAIQITNKVSEPKVIIKPKQGKNQRSKISKRSLRGDSRFVQMAVCELSNYPDWEFKEQYAYEITVNENEEIDNLTASCNEIQGYSGDSTKSLLSHMQKKHHNIKGIKKARNDLVLLNQAIDPEFPVYLSYTLNDLSSVGGGRSRHSEAIYYGVCDKQPIGAISIKHVINQEN